MESPTNQPRPREGLMHPELLAMVPFLVCPGCGRTNMAPDGELLACGDCRATYGSRDGVPFCCDAETARAAFETKLEEVDTETQTPDEIAKANAIYHNFSAGTYDEDNQAVRSITQTGNERISELMRWLRDHGAEGPLVDFGTGTGHLLALAEGILHPRLGLDVSGGMLRQASEKKLPVLVADCRTPPIADEAVGVVVAHSFLHHFMYPEKVLDQMVRVLRPGGWLLVDWEPNRDARPRALTLFVAWLIHPELWFKSLPHLQSEKARRVNELAEYYETMNPGLDAEALASHLRRRGCDDVRVVYHSNCVSALTPALRWKDRVRAVLDGRWPSDRNSAVHFLLLARREVKA